ncbi:serine/threonine protein kinase BUD32 [Aspergillus lucknowensis]|uniref:EKC/KEOPS complex subunit BUD32 n=1 Tax=Aspergillus lucknowensis TaxID=176173 RepID=A0ABR4LRY7_9EURO
MTEYTPPPLPPPFNTTTTPPTLIYQGAEAHLYKTTFLTPTTHAALKIRPSKPYRHPILDRRLTRARILQEARCLHKLVKEGVSVPAVLGLDWEGDARNSNSDSASGGGGGGGGGSWLAMEWVEGEVVRAVLERWERYVKDLQRTTGEGVVMDKEERKVRALMKKIGTAVGSLHKAGVIHGDLTTSNLILRPDSHGQAESGDAAAGASPSLEGEIVMIDFGLASQSSQDEDRAVDLYVLERAFGSSHPRAEGFFEEVLAGYRESYKGAGSALKRLEDVRMRGRKRSMIG